MFNLFNNKSLVDSPTLVQLLDDIISSRANKIGLVRQSNYLWHPSGVDTIRPGLQYLNLKGGQGTFSWGVCIDFIPTITGSKLILYKSAKKFTFHTFEWTDEYSNSFYGGQLQNGVATHWGLNNAKKSIKNLFDRYESVIIIWLDNAKTFEGLIKCLEQQITVGKQYNFHWPNPKYVLAFLYAKTNQTDRAINLFDTLQLSDFANKEDLQSAARIKLLGLSAKNGT
jgi:hypothetical protein